MSRSINQALTLLAVAHGGVRTIREKFEVGVKFKELLNRADETILLAVKHWPGRSRKSVIIDFLERWNGPLSTIPPKWSMLVLIMVGNHALHDLTAKLNDPRKKLLLAPALVALQALDDELDPAGKNIESMEHVNRMLQELYKIIGFEVA